MEKSGNERDALAGTLSLEKAPALIPKLREVARGRAIHRCDFWMRSRPHRVALTRDSYLIIACRIIATRRSRKALAAPIE